MKRSYSIIGVLVGMFISLSTYACNWDRQNCADNILKDVPQQLGELYKNPQFMQKFGNEVQFKAQYTDKRIQSCATNRACNQAYADFAGWIYLNHLHYVKKPQQQTQMVQSSKINDQWTDQCVVGKNMKVLIYNDPSGAKVIGELGETAYQVSQVNGGKLVGLKTVPDYNLPDPNVGAGRFIGWVKKANLDMLDLRNCN